MKNWQWFGHAGHFICSKWCRFHLCTYDGEHLVSTVGEYVPDSRVQESFEEIGLGRIYETMVFKAGKICVHEECNCGLPDINGSELDFEGYNIAGDASKGHLEMCEKWLK